MSVFNISIEEIEETISQFSKKKYDSMIKKLNNFEEMTNRELITTMLILSKWDPDQTISIARKKSLFRYWQESNRENVLELIESLLSFKDYILFSEESINYLEEKAKYAYIIHYYKHVEYKIRQLINDLEKDQIYYKENKQIITSNLKYDLLSILDVWFLAHNKRDKNILNSQELFFNGDNITEQIEMKLEKNNNKKISIEFCKNLSSFSIEEIAVGISYLYKKISKENTRKIIKNDFIVIPNKKSIKKNKKKYFKLIYLASKLQMLVEWEATLDFFDYDVNENNNFFEIEDKKNRLEKSMRIGYAKFDEQRYVFEKEIRQHMTEDSITIDKLVSKLNPKDFFEVTGSGKRKRHRFMFSIELLDLFSKTNFEDHFIELYHLGKEWTLTKEELKSKCIVEKATLYDILQFTFIFKLMSKIMNEYIKMNPKLNNEDIMGMGQIWLLEDQFFDIMDRFLDKSKSKAILNLLSVDTNKPYVDIQYTPLIKVGGRIGIFTSLISSSNMLRNIIKYSYTVNNKVVTNNNGIDGLSKEVANSFRDNGQFKVFDTYKYSYRGIEKEIDVLAVSKKFVYIIECKNSLYPTGAYELRTSIDHLLKAKNQLDFHKEALKNIKSIGNVEVAKKTIVTLIVMGNRIFTGNENYGHPIRPYFELDNILNGGYIETEFAKYRIWEKKHFEEQDLLNYLKYQTSYLKWQFESLIEFESVIKIGKKKLKYISYILNQMELIQKITDNFEVEIIDKKKYDQFLSNLRIYQDNYKA